MASYVSITFVANELLTSTKMNQMAANDAGFNDGTALADGIIVTRHLGSSAVTASKIDFTTFPSRNYINPSNYTAAVPGTAFVSQDIAGASFTVTVPVGMNLRVDFGAAYGGLSTSAPERHLQLRTGATLLKDALALAGAPLSGIYNVAGTGSAITYKLSASTGGTTGNFDYRDLYLNWEVYTPRT